MKLTWQDIDDIAIELASLYSDRDPLALSLDEIRRLVTGLPSFADDPGAADDALLDAIQAAWYEEFQEE